jgi:two-component system, NarL family, invasion response regulator UvrY
MTSVSNDCVRVRGGRRRGLSCALVIDDHPIVLQACRQLLEDVGVRHVFQARTVVSGFELYRQYKPDVIIVDLKIGSSELSGLSFIRQVRAEDKRTPILVFTTHNDDVIVQHTLASGATGYVLKDCPFEDLLKAFIAVGRGQRYLSRELERREAAEANPLDSLTPRELQILVLLTDGKSYRRIARQLQISLFTVGDTYNKIKSKLGINTLPELMRLTMRFLPSAKLRSELYSHQWSRIVNLDERTNRSTTNLS